MVNVRCCNTACGVVFGLPEHIYDQAKLKGKNRSFHCPNGHEQWFTESEEDRQRARADRAERERDLARAARDSAQDERDRNERTARYWKGIAHRKPKDRTDANV